MRKIINLLIVVLGAQIAVSQVVITGSASTTGGYAMPSSNPLVTITISGSAIMNVPNSSTYTALGTFANGSTTDLTSTAIWSSSNSTIASVSATPTPQTVTCNKGGNVTLTATSSGINGTFFLTCVKILTSVAIAPLTPSQNVGSNVNFTATGTYNDGTTADVTTQATWTGSDATVATVVDTGTTPQPANCVGAGTMTVQASFGGFIPSTVLTCNSTGGALTITTTSIPAAVVGIPYRQTVQAIGGTPPYTWSFLSGTLPPGITVTNTPPVGTVSGTPNTIGSSYIFTIKVADSISTTRTLTVNLPVNAAGVDSYCGPNNTPSFGGSDATAQLPQTCYYTNPSATPSPGTFLGPFSDMISLQAAVNSATCGQTVELQAGILLTGTLTLPSVACDQAHYITIQPHSYALNFPPYGTRASPCQWGVASLPGYPSFNCGSTINVGATIQSTGTNVALQFTAPSSSWNIRGIKFTRTSGTGTMSRLIKLEAAGLDHINFQDDWCAGTSTDETQRCFIGDGTSYLSLVDSVINEMHCLNPGSGIHCSASQGVSGGFSTTADHTWKFVNNFWANADNCTLGLGGGATTFTPADIEFRMNWCYRLPSWNPADPSYNGGIGGQPWIVKQGMESKNSNRLLIEGNVFQNVWAGFSQVGSQILLTPKNQAGGVGVNQCPLCVVTNTTIRNNYFSTSNNALQVANVGNDNGAYATSGNNISHHDNVYDNLGYPTCYQCSSNNGGGLDGGTLNDPNAPSSLTLNGFVGNHNTYARAASASTMGGTLAISGPDTTTGNQIQNYVWTNNLAPLETNPISNALDSCNTTPNCNCPAPRTPTQTLNQCFATFNFGGNAFLQPSPGSATWPGTNCTSETNENNIFINWNNGIMLPNGNFQIKSTSPCHNSALDGTDPGANIPAVLASVSGVNSFVSWNPAPPTWVQVPITSSVTAPRDFAIDGSNNLYLMDRLQVGVYVCPGLGTSCTLRSSGMVGNGWSADYDATHNQVLLGTMAVSLVTHFYRTSNLGVTITPITLPFALNTIPTTAGGAAYPANGDIVWGGHYQTGNACGIWRSINGGSSTTGATCSSPIAGIWSINNNPVTNELWAGTEQYGLQKSTDGGNTWTQGSPPDTGICVPPGCTGGLGNGNANGVAFDATGHIIMGGQSGVWKSNLTTCSSGISQPLNSTCTWTSVASGPSTAIRTIYRVPAGALAGNLYYGHRQDGPPPSNPTSVYESTDQGNTWHAFTVGLPTGLEAWRFQYNPNDGHLYVLLLNGQNNTGVVYKY